MRSIILGVILLYLQIFKTSEWQIWGVSPNLMIAYAAYLGAYQKEKLALPLIFILGVGFDLMTPESLGLKTLILLFICWLARYFSKSILEPKLTTITFLAFVFSFCYYLILGMFYSLQTENVSFLMGQFLLSVLINTVFSVILFYFLLFLSLLKFSLRNVS